MVIQCICFYLGIPSQLLMVTCLEPVLFMTISFVGWEADDDSLDTDSSIPYRHLRWTTTLLISCFLGV